MAVLVLNSPDELKNYVGKQIGSSSYVEVTQEMINLFADATGDHQWIHVDVERAKKESPFGGPIAHGYLTLSLIPELLFSILEVKNTKLVVNYGLNKVRFPAPVPAGSKVKASVSIANVEEVKGNGYQVEFSVSINVENAQKPSCVAQVLYRYYK
ncbi:MAG: MaoC family dehydratase [Promethearchaeota archaeon]